MSASASAPAPAPVPAPDTGQVRLTLVDAKGQRGGEPIWCAVDELLSHLAAPAVLAAEVSTKRIASRFAPLPSPRRPRPVALALDRTCTLTPTEVKSGDEHREASRAELQRDEQRRLAIGTLVAEAKKPKVAFDDVAGGLDDKEVLSLAALDAQIDKAAPLVTRSTAVAWTRIVAISARTRLSSASSETLLMLYTRK